MKPKFIEQIKNIFSSSIGIDLGTANTLVCVKDHGIVLDEPSVVAYNPDTQEIHAVGIEAKRMLGRTPENIKACRPMKDGVIADFEISKEMLYYFINKAKHTNRYSWVKPRVLIAVPYGITQVEEKSFKDSARSAGVNDVFLIEEPMAAAIGVGLPVTEPQGNMIVDIGGGTTEVAVISLTGIVECRSEKTAGDAIDSAIIQHIRKSYSITIGERTAEDIKTTIGSAYRLEEEIRMEIRGRDMLGGLPKTITITSDQIREAIMEPVMKIVQAVRATLETIPPELAGDLIENGIYLSGGGAQLRGLDRLLSEMTGLPVFIADEPLQAVAKGCLACLEDPEKYDGIFR